MFNYSNLVRSDYRYTYALVNIATGEVHASSCDHASYAVAHLHRLMMHDLREARRYHQPARLFLVNAVTGEVIEEKGV